MSTPGYIVAANADYWIRVNLAVEIHLKQALLDILHNTDNDPTYQGLPRDGKQLYARMVQFKATYQKKLARVLKKDQWDVLCDQKIGISDSKQWDITLIVVVIINELQLPPPLNGWQQFPPAAHDKSKAAFVLFARYLRNMVKHGSLKDVATVQQFSTIWNQIESALQDVNYKNMKDFNELKTSDLEFYTAAAVNVMKAKYHTLQQEVKQCQNDQLNLQQDIALVAAAREQETNQLSLELHAEIQEIKDLLYAFQIKLEDQNDEHRKVDERLMQVEQHLAKRSAMKEQGKFLTFINVMFMDVFTYAKTCTFRIITN